MPAPTVSAHHPEYDFYRCRWDLVRSVINNDATHWIRTVDPSDKRRSDQYKRDAILTNFTSLTKVGLTGLVFRKKPNVTLPYSIEYLYEDATGDNLGLEQLSQRIVGEILQTGRHGLLVDYPPVSGPVSKYDEKVSGNSARIKPYAAESIINWNTRYIGSKVMLTLVVLCESVDHIGEDGFEWVKKVQYRVLRLNKERVYEQYVYDEDGEIVDYSVPRKADESVFNEIPFQFIGAENNDCKMDPIPLYDLSVLNLGHYRNSADYEESIFITGQPTLFMRGDGSLEEFKSVYPEGIRFGSRAGYYLGVNGGADLIQANPNQLADTAMKRKEEQAVAIGARLISPPGGRETAEAARIRFSSQNSALYILTKNVEIGISNCLNWALDFMSTKDDVVKFELNDQFYDESVDPNVIAQQLMLLDRGIIAPNDVRYYIRKTGVIADSRTDEQIESESDAISPLPEDDGIDDIQG